jgi:transposase InsO family protein
LVIEAIKNDEMVAVIGGNILHGDRGCQLKSSAVRELLKKAKLYQSFSRVGKPGDNTSSKFSTPL